MRAALLVCLVYTLLLCGCATAPSRKTADESSTVESVTVGGEVRVRAQRLSAD